jgi:hypothetical protein
VTKLTWAMTGATTDASAATGINQVGTHSFNKGVTTITYTAYDDAGNTATSSMTVTVSDNEKPSVTPAAITVSSTTSAGGTGDCAGSVAILDATTGDNCGVTTLTWIATGATSCSSTSSGINQVGTRTFNKGVTTITYTVLDAAGNSSTAIVTVTVTDNEKPTVNAGSNVNTTTSADGVGNCKTSVAITAPVSSDNCAVTTMTWTITGATTCSSTATTGINQVGTRDFNKGVSTITYMVKDEAGNTATSSMTVTVTDDENPVVTPASNVNTTTSAGGTGDCTAQYTIPNATTSDNCGVVTLTWAMSGATSTTCTATTGINQVNQQTFNKGITTITYTVWDAAGNSSTSAMTVTVVDDENPTISTFAPSVPFIAPPNHKMRDVVLNYSFGDNCGNSGLTVSSINITAADNGVTGSSIIGLDDWEIGAIGATSTNIKLRAERAGTGEGRTYTIQLVVTDAGGNTSTASTTVIVSHNIFGPAAGKAFKVGSTVNFGGTFWDIPGNRHTAAWIIDGNTSVRGSVTEPSGSRNGTATGSYKFTTPGIYTLQMNLTDQKGVTTYANTNGDLEAIVVIYDPNGGYTVGSGSFPAAKGSIPSQPDLEGNVSFGFQSNYFKGATNPKGETQLGFQIGDFEFNALNFDYLVVSGAKAQFKGSGKVIGDQSGYNFVMTVIDGQVDGTGVDKIHMKIYNKNTGEIIFDNQPNVSEAADPVTAIDAGGMIEIGGSNPLAPTQKISNEALITENLLNQSTLGASVAPNPTQNYSNIKLESSNTREPIVVRVTDQFGRTIEVKKGLSAGQTIQLGAGYKVGMYFVELIQGEERRQVKLIKQ